MKRHLLFLAIIISGIQLNAQRYLTEIFDQVEVTRDVVYGVNATVLPLAAGSDEALPRPLTMDVYEPAGDDNAERPLVLYFHTGNFSPFPQNMSTSGTKRDSTVVEICRRLARMGYVAASVDYRLGWDPFNSSRDIRVFTLINAAYRGVQDARTAIRYFRRTAVEEMNPFGVDTSRITLFGQGTGGYISLNTMVLDDYAKIPTASNGKFLIDVGGTLVPMILENVNGDINGTSVGIVPPELAPVLGVVAGDTLCYPNHVGYSSDFHLTVNLGGAMGDSAWLDPGQTPVISFQTPMDPFAPYEEGTLVVPGVNFEVVEVQGARIIQALANEYGNNQVFIDANIMDEFTDLANSRNDGLEGLCPLIGSDGPLDSSPWDFWDPETNPNHENGLETNPSMSREKAYGYIDTIIGYFAPRAYAALDLNPTSVEDIQTRAQITVFPNPSPDEIFISSDSEHPLKGLVLYDLNGRVVYQMDNLDNEYYMMRRGNLPAGTYILYLQFEDGMASRQIQFR